MIHLERILCACLAALSLLLSSCADDESLTNPGALFAVQYVVEVTDAATVSQIVYTTTTGASMMVDNPTLPFTAEITRLGGEMASLTVTGVAAGVTDSIVARIQDDPNGVVVPVVYVSETCLNQATCNIAIGHTF